MFQSRRVRWSAAAAVAAAVVLVIGFWPGKAGRGPGNGIAWADVAQQLATVKNVSFWMEPRYVSADGNPGHLPWFREYHQDPSLMRREYYGKGNDYAPKPPDQRETPILRDYEIRRINGQEQQWYNVYPGTKKVLHDITFGYPHDRTFQVQDWWNRLQEISSDAAKKVGDQVIGGKSTIVFEAAADKLWGYPSEKGAVTNLRIWVDRSTSLPVRVQFTGKYPNGTFVEQTMEDMRWDVDLPADFFMPPVDFTMQEHMRHFYLPEGTRLKDGVRVRLYAENGFEIFNETQVEGVECMRASAQGIVIDVHFGLPQEMRNRWQQTWPKIEGGLFYDFNGELTANRDGWHTHTFPKDLDLSKLGLTVEQFQTKYLQMPK